MVLRRNSNKGEDFQRQISELRQQLGPEEGSEGFDEAEFVEASYEESRNYGREFEGAEPVTDEGRSQYSPENSPALVDDPAMPVIPAVEAQTTVISHNTSWKGELNAEGSLHLHGEFDGTINAKEDVFILEEARVNAKISAARVLVAGRYDGTITCGQRLEVLPTGKARGDFNAPVLVVHEGAILGGKINMTGNKDKAVKPVDLVRGQSQTGSESANQ